MTRRANGEGSVYRRADGRWTAAHYVLQPNGGRVRVVYGKTRKEAADKLADLVAKTSAGVPMAVRSWTVASYAAHWLEDVVRTRLKPATFMSNRETLRLHILPTLGRVKMHALRPDQVRALLAQRLAAGLSPRSVQIVHGTLRSRLGEAVREEVITLNPSAIVRPPSSEHHADPSVTLRIYAHVIQELTPAVAATFAGAVEAAIRGQSGAVVSNSVSNTDRTPLRPVGQTNSE